MFVKENPDRKKKKTNTRHAIAKNMSTGKAQITKIIQFAGYSGFL